MTPVRFVPRVAAMGLVMLACVACAAITESGNPIPAGAVAFDPPARFRTMWRTVASCSGSAGAFETVDWYALPVGFTLGSQPVDGYWENHGWRQRVYLVRGAAADPLVIRHEMLHAQLLDARHSRRDFVERCGGIVACGPGCSAEAGGIPFDTVGYVAITAREMVQGISVIPPERSDSAWFTIVLTAQNPSTEPRTVTFSSTGVGIETFRWVSGSSADAQFISGSRHSLDGGQRMRYAFDVLPLAADRGRKFTVFGYFNGTPGGSATVVVP